MDFAEYVRHDGLSLARLVRHGEVSAAELLETAIARLEAVNPALNAIVRRRYEQARAEVAAIDKAAPLCGVPFVVKDLIATYAGEPTGSGNRVLATLPAGHDSELVRRWRRAGLVTLARSHTPEFGLTPYTEPECYGPTLNPWAKDRSPGGSSGGSAAAVAAGIVPLASGGDGGGSIRIPASCCALFGFKPSRGLTPTGPAFGELWQGCTIEHVLTRSVRDSAAALDATLGIDGGAPYAAALPAGSLQREVSRDPGRLRIAYTRGVLLGRSVHAECLAALDATVERLRSLGHEVEEAEPPIDREHFATAFVTVLAGETRAQIEQVSRLAGRRRPRAGDFEAATYSLGLLGRSQKAGDFAAAIATLQLAARRLSPFFERYSVLLTPTLATPPAPIGSLQPTPGERRLMGIVNMLGAGWLLGAAGAIDQLAAKIFDYIPFTPLFNVTGQPAMSLPLHWTADGLPVGVHFAGRFADEATLFRLAGQLEKEMPWFGRRPPL